MLPTAMEHVAAVEAKIDADRKEELDRAAREIKIGTLHKIIADAELRKVSPVFSNETAELAYHGMKTRVESLALDYKNRLWHELQAGRKYPLDLASEGAIAYFFGDIIAEKLPNLADCMASRSGKGTGVNETNREQIIAECDAAIATARGNLAALGA